MTNSNEVKVIENKIMNTIYASCAKRFTETNDYTIQCAFLYVLINRDPGIQNLFINAGGPFSIENLQESENILKMVSKKFGFLNLKKLNRLISLLPIEQRFKLMGNNALRGVEMFTVKG